MSDFTYQQHTVMEAARVLGLSERTVRDMIDKREIGHIRARRRVFVTGAQIIAYQKQHGVSPRYRVDVTTPNPHYRPLQVVPPAAS